MIQKKRTLSTVFGIPFALFLGLLVPRPGSATPNGLEMRSERIAARMDDRAETLRLEGQLACTNTNCTQMVLRETRSGQTFNLTPIEGARALMNNGARSVRVQGTRANRNTITIQRISEI